MVMREKSETLKLIDRLKEAVDELSIPVACQADLLFRQDGIWYVAVVKASRQARRAELEGLLAAAMLEVREYAAKEPNQPVPMAIVTAPSLSGAMLADLENFAGRFGRFEGQAMAWGAVDERGLVKLCGPHLAIYQRPSKPKKHLLPASSINLFTDLHQWMLKVLMSQGLPTHLQITGRSNQAPIESATELASIAGVSVPHAARFLASLDRENFLERVDELKLINRESLFSRWQAAYSLRHPTQIRARWLFRQREPQQHLQALLTQRWEQSQDVCLGLFAACKYWGYGHVEGVSPHILVKQYSPELLKALKLTLAEPGESVDVFLQEPHFPQAVFRGVQMIENCPIADILQCWLDVAAYPARGDEMAQLLYDHVIEPFLISQP